MKEKLVNELKLLGYNPSIQKYERYYDIKFTSYGFDNFKDKHKDIIRKLCGFALIEFYYGSDTQHIYIKNEKVIRKLKLEEINKNNRRK